MSFKWNPTIEQCKLEDALERAEQKRKDLPHVVQVRISDWDTCVLADEVNRLQRVVDAMVKGRKIITKTKNKIPQWTTKYSDRKSISL